MVLIDLKCDRCGRIARDQKAGQDGAPCRSGGFIGSHGAEPPPSCGTLRRMWSNTRTAAVPPSGTYSFGS